jgi:outer membrane cobalamin receptor
VGGWGRHSSKNPSGKSCFIPQRNTGFNLGVGFINEEMPDDIGNWVFEYVEEEDRKYDAATQSMKSNKKKIKSDVENCGDGESFKNWKSTFKTAVESTDEEDFTPEAKAKKIAEEERVAKEWPFRKLMCSSTVFNHNIRGSKFSKKYNRIKIRLDKCVDSKLKPDKDGNARKCRTDFDKKQFF